MADPSAFIWRGRNLSGTGPVAVVSIPPLSLVLVTLVSFVHTGMGLLVALILAHELGEVFFGKAGPSVIGTLPIRSTGSVLLIRKLSATAAMLRFVEFVLGHFESNIRFSIQLF